MVEPGQDYASSFGQFLESGSWKAILVNPPLLVAPRMALEPGGATSVILRQSDVPAN
jgi:hypothetical protein